MKCCTKCGIEKPLSEFHKNKRMKDGLKSYCKPCNTSSVIKWKKEHPEKNRKIALKWKKDNPEKSNALNALHYSSKIQAIPLWFEAESVANVYKKAQEFGFQVDHIVPLKGKTVCGLHCWANLQLLDGSLNASKNNREWPDMPIPESLKIISPRISDFS